MGKDLYCDLCRRSVALESALKPITIGESKACEVCLNCASSIETSLKRQKAEAEMTIKAAQSAVSSPRQEPGKLAAKPAAATSEEEIISDTKPGL